MNNRMTSAVPSLVASVVVLAIAAMASVQTGHAQISSIFQAKPQETAQAKAQAKADECLARPGATAPKGSHWFYRIERKSNRRCWYLGPASQKVARPAASAERAVAAERPAPAARRSVPTPAPEPSELRADEETRAEMPAADAVTEARNAAPSDWSPVAATNFSAAWPAGTSADADAAEAAAQETTTATADNEAAVAAAESSAEDMPLVWPVMSAAERAAVAQPAASAPGGIAQLLIFLAATMAFVAIAIRVVLKLVSAPRAKPAPREPVRPAEPIIRRRAPGRFATEPSIEAMSEPAIARLREVAKRWDTPARVPRQARLPAFEVEPDYEVRVGPPRRRAVA
jgi:hypothetical protein